MKSIILASSSPRRIELLKKAGFDISVVPANIDENISPNLPPEEVVRKLSYDKAFFVKKSIRKTIGDIDTKMEFPNQPNPSTLSTELLSDDIPIVGADTIVYLDEIIGKPKDRDDALSILMRLSGRAHEVYTGVTILSLLSHREKTFSEKTTVFFKSYSPDDLIEYLDSPEPYDKAGGYAIQGFFGRYIDHIEGDYDNVMGLPVKSLCSAISDF